MNNNEKDSEVMKMEMLIKEGIKIEEAKRGGFRPNAGRPQGAKNKLTKDAKVREKGIKERILKNVDDLVNSQLALARGISFLYEIKMRNVAGRRKPEHILVKDPKRIKQFLDGDLEGEYYYISQKAPDNRAIDSLLDRAFGKATTENNVNHDFNINVINYAKEERNYIDAESSDTNNNPPRLYAEGIPVRDVTSTSEVQDSSMVKTFGKIEDSAKRAD